MSSQVVHQPKRLHHCRIGWKLVPLPDDHPARASGGKSYLVEDGLRDPSGTIRECDTCGKTWVAYKLTGSGVLRTQWRGEGRIARWRRERRQTRTNQTGWSIR